MSKLINTEHKLTIFCNNDAVFERFQYWLSDVVHEFDDCCCMGGLLDDNSMIEFEWDSNNTRMRIKKRL